MSARSSVSSIAGSLLGVILWLAPLTALAHEGAPGVLGVEERGDGRYLVAWTPPLGTSAAFTGDARPRFPERCQLDGNVLDCGARGLEGTITIDDLDFGLRVMVSITPRGAPPIDAMLDADSPSLSLDGASRGRGGGAILAWIGVGAEHVLLGLDHLAFVLALLLVSQLGGRAGRGKRVVSAITAFTIGHSITLALAALGLVHVPSAFVEAAIALSVLLVAREGLTRGEGPDGALELDRLPRTSAIRSPALVAALFGLVHGLGFASVLEESALPERALVPALFGFNVGVELGQLAFVAVALLALRASLLVCTSSAWRARSRVALVYALGAASGFWFVTRVAEIAARL